MGCDVLLSVNEAYHRILDSIPSMRTETLDLADATGRILAESVRADRDYPPIHRATMDGIAISSHSWDVGTRVWNIEQTVPAGKAAAALRDPSSGCALIMTGAEVPDGCDSILPFEDIERLHNQAKAHTDAAVTPRQFVHQKASDRRAGDVLITEGALLDSARIAVLAAVGHTPVRVFAVPRVAVISTGDEIVSVEQKDIAPTSSRASNAYALVAGLRQCGIAHITRIHLNDDLEKTRRTIAAVLAQHDVLLLTGGVSKGDYDFVPRALNQCGVRKVFHGVAQKPGKPFWFGRSPITTVFGLPGNPVSTLTVFRRYVVPAIQRWSGQPLKPVRSLTRTHLTQPHPTLTTFQPVRLVGEKIEHIAHNGSGDFAALSESDGFIEVPASKDADTKNTTVNFWSW